MKRYPPSGRIQRGLALILLLGWLLTGCSAVPAGKVAPSCCDRQAEESANALTAYLDSLEGSVSVCCVRLSDGDTYEYHADAEYYAASLLKAPYALWLAKRADTGEIDLSCELPGREDTALPQTAFEAIYAMISQSDNDATAALYRLWPADEGNGFGVFLQSIGVDRPDSALTEETGIHGVLSARDAVSILLALEDYFESGAPHAAALKQAFLDAGHPMLESEYDMAKKYGSWENTLHDMAIVYADDPYCIAVLSNWGDSEVDFPEPGTGRITEIGSLAADRMTCAPEPAA